MKKLLFLEFILFFILGFLLLIKNNNTYAYEDCHNKKINPKETTTLNLESYIKNNNYNLIGFCSFDMCYKKREKNLKESINNFQKLFDKELSEEDYYELNIKGYPITSITIDAC